MFAPSKWRDDRIAEGMQHILVGLAVTVLRAQADLTMRSAARLIMTIEEQR